MSATIQPITYRLPKPGERDPYFHLSRAFYYAGEARGYWQLIRVRAEGKDRGATLVPFSAVSEFVSKLIEEQSGSKDLFEPHSGKSAVRTTAHKGQSEQEGR